MEFLAGLYTLLLVTICLLLAVVLWKLNKPRNGETTRSSSAGCSSSSMHRQKTLRPDRRQ